MVFRPPPKPPEFADLKGVLAQTKNIDSALYQTIQVLIDRLELLRTDQSSVVDGISQAVNDITNVINISTNTDATYLMAGNESLYFPNSKTLLPGTNITFDDTVPNQRKINATGGGGPGGGMNLDYLGNYVQGPVYNDGDIVIGVDGVAYMCTVDGTVTPPEPWPGVGVAANIALDATYWLVSPNAYLPNARALNAFGAGYVRSQNGVPSVVATIPLTDTTGILPDNRLTSNVALKNIDNGFVAQTFASFSRIYGSNSALIFADTAAPVNSTIWRLLGYGNGNFYVEALNDDNTVLQTQYYFRRDGYFGATGFIGDGSNVTNLNASNLALGLANPARLGNGTANSSTFLRGDSTWAPVPTGESFPSGLMVLSNSPCPAGWTRVTIWDGLFIRSNSVHQAGGTTSHSHGPGTMVAAGGHNHTGWTGPADIAINPNTTLSGDHSHNYGGTVSGSTGAATGQTSGADAGGSFTAPYASHGHDFSAGYSGVTNPGGNHSHGVTVTGGGGSPIYAEAAIPLSGATDAQNHIPPFVDLFICQKN